MPLLLSIKKSATLVLKQQKQVYHSLVLLELSLCWCCFFNCCIFEFKLSFTCIISFIPVQTRHISHNLWYIYIWLALTIVIILLGINENSATSPPLHSQKFVFTHIKILSVQYTSVHVLCKVITSYFFIPYVF